MTMSQTEDQEERSRLFEGYENNTLDAKERQGFELKLVSVTNLHLHWLRDLRVYSYFL